MNGKNRDLFLMLMKESALSYVFLLFCEVNLVCVKRVGAPSAPMLSLRKAAKRGCIVRTIHLMVRYGVSIAAPKNRMEKYGEASLIATFQLHYRHCGWCF